MKTLFKIIAGLLLLLVIAVAAVLITFDPNDYKSQLTQVVETQTGRKLVIAGDIKLSLFPWVGLEMGKLSLSNAPGFSDADFARISQLDIKVKLLPLLKREVEIDKVRLHGLFASLETDKDGNTNWQDLAKPNAAAAPQAPPAAPEADVAPQSAAAPALAGLVVNGIELIDANLQLIDNKAGTQTKVSHLNLETGAIKFDSWVPVKFSAQLNTSQPEADVAVTLDTRIRINQALNVFSIEGLQLNVDALIKSVLPDRIALQVKLDASADMQQQQVSVKRLEVAALGAVLSSEMTVSQLDTTANIVGTVSTNVINPRVLAQKFGVALPDSRNAQRLSALQFSSQLQATPTHVRLDNIVLTLDDSKLIGHIHVNDIAKPDIAYQLQLDAIDVDSYLPAPVAAPVTAAAQTPAPAAADVEIALPLELLRALKLDGSLVLHSVKVSDIAIAELTMNTRAADGIIKVDPLSMNLLDGRFTAGLTLDARGATPTYHLTANADGIKPGGVVNPLLVSLLGNQELALEGVAQFVADIKTGGTWLRQLKQAASGHIAFNMSATQVTGVDINYYLRDAIASYVESKKLAVPEDFRGDYTPQQKTAFDKVVVTATLAGGKVNNDKLLLDSRRLKVNGSGVIDIINNTLDEKITVQLDAERDKTVAEKILQKPVGVHVHGGFAQPVIDIDYAALGKAIGSMLSDEAKAKAGAALDKKKQELKAKEDALKAELKAKEAAKKNELKQKAQDKLKGLFK